MDGFVLVAERKRIGRHGGQVYGTTSIPNVQGASYAAVAPNVNLAVGPGLSSSSQMQPEANMDDDAPELTLGYIRDVLAEDIRSDAGPGKATGSYNRSFIETFRATGGQMPGDLGQVPWMLLTAVGAKSGRERTVPLAFFDRDGVIYIIASKGGALTHPAWFHNLVANPDVIAEFGQEPVPSTAVVLDGAERDEVFAWVADQNRTFAKYQARTDRVIPVVRLDPK